MIVTISGNWNYYRLFARFFVFIQADCMKKMTFKGKRNKSRKTLKIIICIARKLEKIDTFKAFSMAFNLDLKDFTSRIPYLNMNAQKENYAVGLGCFMLVKYGFIRDPNEAFSGFDT